MRFPEIIFIAFLTGLGCSHKKLEAEGAETSPPDSSEGNEPDTLFPPDSSRIGVETDSTTDKEPSSIDKDTSTATDSDGMDTDTEPVLCMNGMCPDDDNLCNGQEVCDPSSGTCLHVNPLMCENDLLCDGAEICDPLLGCLDAPDVERRCVRRLRGRMVRHLEGRQLPGGSGNAPCQERRRVDHLHRSGRARQRRRRQHRHRVRTGQVVWCGTVRCGQHRDRSRLSLRPGDPLGQDR